ncbi:MAG: 50S ribosomal protein L19e [Ferroplasma sp.]
MKMLTVREISADELKVGKSRVWIDTNSIDKVLDAASREDIRKLIDTHVIQRREKKNHSNQRLKKRIVRLAKGRRGPGSVKGTKYARYPRKRRWISTIRALRSQLKTMRDNGTIEKTTYKKYYRTIKSGSFVSRAQLVAHLKTQSLVKEDKNENNTSS